MSSYLSTEYKIQAPQESVNVQLVGGVLNKLQNKYDVNKSLIEQTIAKYEMLRGLSDSDNAYIASVVKEAEASQENYSKLNGDLSRSSVVDTMQSVWKGVYNDPIVKNAVMQKAKYDNYNLQVDEIKKKKLKLYSNMNYQDSLEQAGLDKYMKGEVKTLGNLQYNEYVNLPEKLNKKADEYAKSMGFERIMGSNEKDYYYEDIKGKKVTKEEIYSKLESELDEKDKVQLQINTRQSLGKMSQQDLDLTIAPIVTNNLIETKAKKAQLEAKLASATSKEEQDNYKMQLVGYDSKIKNYSNQLSSKKYDLYGVYKEDFLSRVASNYDINVYTDIKRDNIKLDVLKYQFDQYKWKADYAQKEREVIAKEREVSMKEAELKALTEPTIIEKPKTDEEAKKPATERLNEQLKSADAGLDKYLTDNIAGYKEKSANEKFEYKRSLKTGDPSLPIEAQNLIKNYSQALEGTVSIIKDNTEKLKSSTAIFFNGITGAKINNLAGEMPYTVSLLKQKKKFEDLTETQKAGVMLETGSNTARHIEKTTELMSVLNHLNGSLANNKSNEAKAVYNTTIKSFKNIDARNYPGFQPVKLPGMGVGFIARAGNVQPFTQDTDITEIEKYTGDANVNGSEHFNAMVESMKETSATKADSYMPNLSTNKAMSWSTENKYQQPTTVEIQSAVLAEHPDLVLPKDNNFIVSREGSGYNINLDVKNSKGKIERVTKYVEKLAEQTLSKLNTTEQEWHSNLNNPNLILPEFSFGLKMRIDSMNKMKAIAKNRPDLIPPNVRRELINRGTVAGTEYQSDQDIMDWVEDKHKNISKQQQEKLSEIFNATYKVDYEVVNGEIEGTITVPGTQNTFTFGSKQKELDEGKLYVETLQQINEYKLNRIDKVFK